MSDLETENKRLEAVIEELKTKLNLAVKMYIEARDMNNEIYGRLRSIYKETDYIHQHESDDVNEVIESLTDKLKAYQR